MGRAARAGNRRSPPAAEEAIQSCAKRGTEPELALPPADVPFWKLLNYPNSCVFHCLFIKRSQKSTSALLGRHHARSKGKLFSERVPREDDLFLCLQKILIIHTL